MQKEREEERYSEREYIANRVKIKRKRRDRNRERERERVNHSVREKHRQIERNSEI